MVGLFSPHPEEMEKGPEALGNRAEGAAIHERTRAHFLFYGRAGGLAEAVWAWGTVTR